MNTGQALAFLDTETTGLDHEHHEVWEIALLLEQDGTTTTHHWMIQPNLATADPKALEISRYWERTDGATFDNPAQVCAELARLLVGATVLGSNPAFDERFLTRLLRRHGHTWTAHYRSIDIITLAAGHLGARPIEDLGALNYTRPTPPYSSHAISRAIGVEPGLYSRHTALGDVLWTRELYVALTAAQQRSREEK